MHHAFFRAEPAELAVRPQFIVEAADISGDVGQVHANHQVAHALHSRAANVIAAANGKNQAVARVSLFGFDNDIGSGIIRVFVSRI